MSFRLPFRGPVRAPLHGPSGPTSRRPGIALLAVLTVGLTVGCHRASPVPMAEGRVPDALVRQLEARIAQVPGAEVAIAVQDLASGRRLDLRGDTLYHAASTMKVPVLFALYQAFRAGTLQADQTIPLENRFTSIADGSSYALNAADDSDSSVYAMVGTAVPVRLLARRMITHSSNLATNALITLLNPVKITALTRELGATRMLVRRGVEDTPAFRAGLNNVTTANDLVALFVALENARVANATDTREMLDILEAQAFNEQIPAGLPAGTRVAHKTGSITATWHDAGLVYPAGRRPYAIAILTRNIPERAVGDALIADCSRLIWQWLAVER
jgi:beta-lactamase class A